MNKKKSVINPTTICMIICAIFVSDAFYKSFQYSVGDPIGAVNGRLLLGATGAITGAIFGLILSFIAKLFFKPSRTSRLIREQNNILSDNDYNKNNKVDELNKLNELKKNGTLSEEEFKKLKYEILNRR